MVTKRAADFESRLHSFQNLLSSAKRRCFGDDRSRKASLEEIDKFLRTGIGDLFKLADLYQDLFRIFDVNNGAALDLIWAQQTKEAEVRGI